jgi:RecG-like helicase
MQVAYKVWIGGVMNGNMTFNGEKFVSVEVSGKQMSRVNFIANVVDTYTNDEKKFNSVTLDDGSGQIRVKGFSDSFFLLQGITVGDTICTIGWLRHFNNELYLVPDIVRHVEGKWALVRRLELIKMFGEPKTSENQPEHEPELEVKNEKLGSSQQAISPRNAIIALIKKHEQGIDVEQLIMETNYPVDQVSSIINSLIESGEIYEPMPGKVRFM